MLDNLIRQVYEQEQALVEAKAAYDERYLQWLEENAEVIERKAFLEQAVKMGREEIKAETLRIYTETGNKKPHPATTIAIHKIFVIDEDKAVEWADAHAPVLLMKKLNTKLYEKVLQDGDFKDMPGEITEEARVRLASDFGKLLED